jgi:hypothetical protein
MHRHQPQQVIILLINIAVCFLNLTCGSDSSNNPIPIKPGYTYQAVEYVITEPDGSQIILRSRGTGNGVNDSYFDIYIEDSNNKTTAFRGDPVWFTYPLPIAQAITQTNTTKNKRGDLPTPNSFYFIDINGGSEMGGVSYHFHTNTTTLTQSTIVVKPQNDLLLDTIAIDIEHGGTVLDSIGVEINGNGGIFWNGSSFVTNSTAAHSYFYRPQNGNHYSIFQTDTVDAVGSGSRVIDLNGDTISVVQNTYTYTVEKSSTSDDAENLGSSFPIDFEIQVSGLSITIPIRVARFTPKLLNEQKH